MNFNNLPERMYLRFRTMYRERNVQELKKILIAHKVYTGCPTCLDSGTIMQWSDWAINNHLPNEESTGLGDSDAEVLQSNEQPEAGELRGHTDASSEGNELNDV